jgi:resuscitation-promoting factor RpfB
VAIAGSSGSSVSASAQSAGAAYAISAVTTARVTQPTANQAAVARSRRHVRLSRNEVVAWRMLHKFGWRPRQEFRFLRWLWMRESSWNVYAANPYSGAYGIPQALPGGKMASAGRNWRTSAKVQIRWGLRYIKALYKSPARAWWHERNFGWY